MFEAEKRAVKRRFIVAGPEIPRRLGHDPVDQPLSPNKIYASISKLSNLLVTRHPLAQSRLGAREGSLTTALPWLP